MKKTKKSKPKAKKPKKHVPQHIYDEIFGTNYWVSYGISYSRWREAVQRTLGYKLPPNERIGGTCKHFESENGSEVIWIWTKRRKVYWLAHECFHAVHFALENKVPLTLESSETYAYLIEFLMERILKK